MHVDGVNAVRTVPDNGYAIFIYNFDKSWKYHVSTNGDGTEVARRKVEIEKLDGVAHGVVSALRVYRFVRMRMRKGKRSNLNFIMKFRVFNGKRERNKFEMRKILADNAKLNDWNCVCVCARNNK